MKTFRITFIAIFLFIMSMGYGEDYYWVGGTGNWSDLNSWRTATGQIPNEVPDAQDNVYFNENSFVKDYDTVFIVTGNPTCKDFIWQNIQDTVVMVGGSSLTTFSIYGSVKLHHKLLNYYFGKIKMLSDQSGETITSDGARFAGDLIFEGEGEWILQDTLKVIDSVAWKPIIFGLANDTTGYEAVDPNPVIQHMNGTLDANGQTIATRGFSTTGNMSREVNLDNCHIYLLGNWTVGAENLDFSANNSYILMGGEMSNFKGDEITYNDIDFMWPDGAIKNTDIRTIHRKVHFLGSGTIDGKKSPGQEGMVTIDTLLFNGAVTMMGPILCEVKGPNFDIHYTDIELVPGIFDCLSGDFHRVDYNDEIPWGYSNEFKGRNNSADTINFFHPAPAPAKFVGLTGKNTVNGLLYFNVEGIISSPMGFENQINHAVCRSDVTLEGSNTIDWLTLNSGYWCQMQADSLGFGQYTYSFIQTIGQIDVMGDCNSGVCRLTSDFKEVQAIMEYLGNPLNPDYLMVKDINNIGSLLTINNGIDGGNNNGFSFVDPLGARDLYWVGGKGYWNQNIHWSLNPTATVGDQCPPTALDNVHFTATSGFTPDDTTVVVNVKHAFCNNMTWDPVLGAHPWMISGEINVDTIWDTVNIGQYTLDSNFIWIDSVTFDIYGSVRLDTSMTYAFLGDVYFSSEDDNDYESLYFKNRLQGTDVYNLWGKTFFYGRGGKWELGSNLFNTSDSLLLRMGRLKSHADTINCLVFIANDTMPKGLYLLDSIIDGKRKTSLLKARKWQSEAFVFAAHFADSITFLDAAHSTIQVVGDLQVPFGQPPGYCSFRTTEDPVDYWNVVLGDTLIAPLVPVKNRLIGESQSTYNLVDYYCTDGTAENTGIVDTMTFKRLYVKDPNTGALYLVSADRCILRQNYHINFLIGESPDNSIYNNHLIDTVLFKMEDDTIFGGSYIGYMRADKFTCVRLFNHIDTAVFRGNGSIIGRNEFSQLKLAPNKRYTFGHETMTGVDTTIINDDFIANGYCDKPIRLESDSIGTQAKILYKKQNPSPSGDTVYYASIKDIKMLPYNGNVYIAHNSVNLGNNTNWTFTDAGNNIYYWIGGSGKWGDWMHWSYQSGGMPIGDRCTPREINTVVFDDNSFLTPADSVVVDVKNAYCKNMWWNHTPTSYNPIFFGSDTTDLFVYGSMQLNDSMDYEYSGIIHFDQYEEPNDVADTITSKGHILLNDIYFQGIDDYVMLADSLTMLVAPPNVYRHIFLEHGTLSLNGQQLYTAGFFSVYKNSRTLDMTDSRAIVAYDYERTWWIDGDNFTLKANNSTLINLAMLGTIITEHGTTLQYNNVIMEMPLDSLFNKDNVTEYNVVALNNEQSLVSGNFVADTVLLKGMQTAMFNKSQTNVVIINGAGGSINQKHNINHCEVNNVAFVRGRNNFKYCVFNDDGYFLGHNVFDTLVLYPGQGDNNNLGNWFYFQVDSTQVIIDSLYMRGNQCSNMNISTYPANSPKIAYLQKDDGFDISCDYLNIHNVGATSANDIKFYAGTNSTALPDPNNPPPGWIFDNAQGYIPGFNGRTERFCLGSPFVIDAASFNGTPSTLYYWEGSQYPGNSTYTITEPGTYHIRVQYFEGCYVDDYINIEGDFAPEVKIDPGPFCVGDPIGVTISPENGHYSYDWFNQDTTATIEAKVEYSSGISVTVGDVSNNCKTTTDQYVLVKPVPHPEDYLGPDVTLKFGETITLNAGPGDYYEWSSTPTSNIGNTNQESITVPGTLDTIEYKVLVDLNGCTAEGYKKVVMYPPSKLGIPTAFSPNGDGWNDVLYVFGSGFAQIDFRIYNRFGELVFATTDPKVGWDGTYKGQKQEMDVYTYHISVVYLDKGTAEESGNITLLR